MDGDFVARERATAWVETLRPPTSGSPAVQVRENTEQDAYDGASLLLDVEDRPDRRPLLLRPHGVGDASGRRSTSGCASRRTSPSWASTTRSSPSACDRR